MQTVIERPIAIGVLKIKTKLGELIPSQQGKKADDFSYPLGKRWTQAAVAKCLGIARETVRDWFQENISNGEAAKANNHDACISLSKEKRREVLDRVEAGEPQSQIAADVGISHPCVSQIVKTERKRGENRAMCICRSRPIRDKIS